MIKNLFITIEIIIFVLLTNVLIYLVFLRINPDFLITNKNYQEEHKQIVVFLLTGNSNELSKRLPEAEFNHIKDVRSVIKTIPFLIIVFLIVFKIQKINKEILIKLTRNATIIILVISLITAVFFEKTFILFHQIFFPQGNWSFPAESILIQLYPDQFWQLSSLIIIILTVVELVAIPRIYRIYSSVK